MQKLGVVLIYTIITILLSGVIFIAPDIFISRFYTFQMLWSVGGLAMICTLFLAIRKNTTISLNTVIPIILALICLLVYSPAAIKGIVGLLFVFGIVSFMIDNMPLKIYYRDIYNLLSLLAGAQALFGLGQYFSLLPRYSSFPVTGTFDNPAGFAACLTILFPFVLYKDSSVSYREWSWKGCIAMTCMIAIFLSESRTGILAMLCVLLLWLYRDTKVLTFFKQLRIRTQFMILTLVGVLAIVVLYIYKLDSANGRLLIWQVSLSMIGDSPLLGIGTGGFWANYMQAQADYFTIHPTSHFIMLADNVKHAFNEYLHVLVEYGVIGVIILVGYIVFVYHSFRYKPLRYKSPAVYSLVSLFVHSLFSYPLSYPFVWILAGVMIAIISHGREALFRFPPLARFVVALVIACAVFPYVYQKWNDEAHWFNIANQSIAGKTKEMLPEYEALLKRMNDEGLFLYNYGAELAYIEDYGESNKILEECCTCFNDIDVQLLMAENHTQLKQYDKAEHCLLTARAMCPNRFVPPYKLVKLYQEQGKNSAALNIAKQILEMEIKVPSATVDIICLEMKEFIQSTCGKHGEIDPLKTI